MNTYWNGDPKWIDFLNKSESESLRARKRNSAVNAKDRYAAVDWNGTIVEAARVAGVSFTAAAQYGRAHGFITGRRGRWMGTKNLQAAL